MSNFHLVMLLEPTRLYGWQSSLSTNCVESEFRILDTHIAAGYIPLHAYKQENDMIWDGSKVTSTLQCQNFTF